MRARPKLSVIVPTYNRRAVLERCLPSVLAADFPRSDFEVVVVIDGSTDGSGDYVRGLGPEACRLSIVEQPNRGLAAARNAGAKAATGELILFLDDDIYCPRDLLAKHARAHVCGEPALVVWGPLLAHAGSNGALAADWMAQTFDQHLAMVAGNGGRLQRYQTWLGPNFSMQRSFFFSQGGYDEQFRGALEDADLGFRLFDSGAQFLFEPDAVAYHVYAKSDRDMVRRDSRLYGSKGVLLCRKHPDYRSHSPLAQLSAGPRWKRVLRESMARYPLAVETPLAACCWSAERMPRIRALRRLAALALQWRSNAMLLHGALQAAGSWDALRGEFGLTLPVLRYQSVRSPVADGEAAIAPRQLERDLRWLARRGYTGIRPSQWLDWMRVGRGLPDKPVLLVFGPAAGGLLEAAGSELRRHGFGGLVLVEAAADGLCAAELEQLRNRARHGIETGIVGCAGCETALLNPSVVADELGSMRRELGSSGERPLVFAYPQFAYNDGVRDAVSQSFAMGLTSAEGLNNLAGDPLAMKTTAVMPGQSLIGLACQVRWGRNPLRPMRERRGRPLGGAAVRVQPGWEIHLRGATRHNVVHVLGGAQAENAGPARVVANLALGLDRNVYNLEAWFLGGDGPLADELRALGIGVRVMRWSRAASDPRGAWAFANALRRTPVSIAHLHIGGRLVRKIVRRMTRAAVVMHLHSCVLEMGGVQPAVVDGAGVDAVVAVSRAVAAMYTPARVVYTGVPLPPPSANHCRAGLVIGTAGRLVALKGVNDLIAATAILRREFSEVRLEIAGDGPLRDALQSQAEELGIGRAVKFLGWRGDLNAVLATWDAFVLPSLEEGLGVVVLEAMAAELPVIATAVGGVPEVVEEGRTGWLVPPSNPAAIAQCLRALIIDPNLRRTMGAAGRERVREHFSVAAMGAGMGEIYGELTAPRGSARRVKVS